MYLTVDYFLAHRKLRTSIEDMLLKQEKSGSKEILEVTSLFMTKGKEYQMAKKMIQKYKKSFEKIIIGKPLLCNSENREKLANILFSEFKELTKDGFLIFVGHGRKFTLNLKYLKFERKLQKVFGTKKVKIILLKGFSKRNFEQFKGEMIHIVPLMINCGNHVKNDIFGKNGIVQVLEEKTQCKIEKHFTSLLALESFKKEFLYEKN